MRCIMLPLLALPAICTAQDPCDGLLAICGKGGKASDQDCVEKDRCEVQAGVEHELRCCHEAEEKPPNVGGDHEWVRGRNLRTGAKCKIWARSLCDNDHQGGTDTGHSDAGTRAYAEKSCKDLGARLCTVQEISDGCTRRSGCDHSTDIVWTSTKCKSTECVITATATTATATTATTATDTAVARLHERVEQLESSLGKDWVTSPALQGVSAAVAAVEAAVKAQAGTVGAQATALREQQTQLDGQRDAIAELSGAVAALSRTVQQIVAPVQPPPPPPPGCAAGQSCPPEIAANDGDVVLKAISGTVQLETSKCGAMDLCQLAQDARALITKLESVE